MTNYSPAGSPCTYCGDPMCDGCPLCCCKRPEHRHDGYCKGRS